MRLLAPDAAQIQVLRDMARAGFVYAAVKRHGAAAGWVVAQDEPDLGFVQYFITLGADLDDRRLLSVGIATLQTHPPHVYLPLFYFGDEGEDLAEEKRHSFDEAYRRLADRLRAILGLPTRAGTYEYAHRHGWLYSYSRWQLEDAQVILLQDEHDIQFGMDVSLWVFLPRVDIAVPLPF